MEQAEAASQAKKKSWPQRKRKQTEFEAADVEDDHNDEESQLEWQESEVRECIIM